MILTQCIRCWTRYCDASCQLEHWNNGHKKQCKKIARGGGAEQFYADAKAKEAAEAAVAECLPEIPVDAICYICRDDASRQGLVTGCGCHGGDGIAHVSCLARMARMAVKEIEEGGGGKGWKKWERCFECREMFRGGVIHALGWACWSEYLRRPASWGRARAMGILGCALKNVDPEAAISILEAQITSLSSFGIEEDLREDILSAQTDIAHCYFNLGRYDETLRLQRTIYSGMVAVCGPEHEDTILDANNLTESLTESGLFDEAKKFARKIHRTARRALGDTNLRTLRSAQVYADALLGDPCSSRLDVIKAVELQETVKKASTRLFGPEHPRTTRAISGLADARRRLELQPEGRDSSGGRDG